MESKTYVRTMNGHAVELLDPDPATIDLDDIVYNLCNSVRFNGGMEPAWTVGSHCLLVMAYAWMDGCGRDVQRWALMHDWHEAYTGDIPSPLKAIIAGQTKVLELIENALDEAIAEALGVDVPSADTRERVHKYDTMAFEFEQRELRGEIVKGTLPTYITRMHDNRFEFMLRAAATLGVKHHDGETQ
jgi:hypothetical protein